MPFRQQIQVEQRFSTSALMTFGKNSPLVRSYPTHSWPLGTSSTLPISPLLDLMKCVPQGKKPYPLENHLRMASASPDVLKWDPGSTNAKGTIDVHIAGAPSGGQNQGSRSEGLRVPY